MDKENNVTLCTAAVVVRKIPHSLILDLVVFYCSNSCYLIGWPIRQSWMESDKN